MTITQTYDRHALLGTIERHATQHSLRVGELLNNALHHHFDVWGRELPLHYCTDGELRGAIDQYGQHLEHMAAQATTSSG